MSVFMSGRFQSKCEHGNHNIIVTKGKCTHAHGATKAMQASPRMSKQTHGDT